MSVLQSLVVAGTGMVVVFAELILLAVIIMLLSKIIRALTKNKSKAQPIIAAAAAAVSPAATMAPLPDTQSAGRLDLHDVDDKTAAMLMAIVSHEAGIPLNELRFLSIRALDDLQEGMTK